jgi:hypothetical protein
LCGVEMWALRKSFEMWCWRMMEKIGWADRVKNEVLQRVKKEGNILHFFINTVISNQKTFTVHHFL